MVATVIPAGSGGLRASLHDLTRDSLAREARLDHLYPSIDAKMAN